MISKLIDKLILKYLNRKLMQIDSKIWNAQDEKPSRERDIKIDLLRETYTTIKVLKRAYIN